MERVYSFKEIVTILKDQGQEVERLLVRDYAMPQRMLQTFMEFINTYNHNIMTELLGQKNEELN